MKIRTDFVTNSSSSSFVSVHIENGILAEIIDQHQGILENIEGAILNKSADGTLVLDFEDDETGSTPPPTTKGSFVESLIEFLDIDCGLQSCEPDDLYEDLRQNKDEIVAALKNVHWEYYCRGWDESEERINWSYSETDLRRCLQLDDNAEITDAVKEEFDEFVRLSSSEDERSYSFDGKTEQYKESFRLEYDFQRTDELTGVHSDVPDNTFKYGQRTNTFIRKKVEFWNLKDEVFPFEWKFNIYIEDAPEFVDLLEAMKPGDPLKLSVRYPSICKIAVDLLTENGKLLVASASFPTEIAKVDAEQFRGKATDMELRELGVIDFFANGNEKKWHVSIDVKDYIAVYAEDLQSIVKNVTLSPQKNSNKCYASFVVLIDSKEKVASNAPNGDTIVAIAKIRLSATSRGKIYDFLCGVENVEAGDSVLLEGYGDQPYTVLSVEKKEVNDLELPFSFYKKVISKL